MIPNDAKLYPSRIDGDTNAAELKNIVSFYREYAWKALERTASRLSRIDTKINTLMGFVGVMITLLTTWGTTLGKSTFAQSIQSCEKRLIFVLGISALFVALASLLWASQTQDVRDIPRFKDVADSMAKSESERDFCELFFRSCDEVNESYRDLCLKKAFRFKLANWALSAGVILLLIWGASAFK